MIEENLVFEEESPQLSSRTLSFYGTHQKENKSKILYPGGFPFVEHPEFEKLKVEYIFHVFFQLSSIIDYVSILNINI